MKRGGWLGPWNNFRANIGRCCRYLQWMDSRTGKSRTFLASLRERSSLGFMWHEGNCTKLLLPTSKRKTTGLQRARQPWQPFRIIGITVEGALELVRAVITLPARLLGYRSV